MSRVIISAVVMTEKWSQQLDVAVAALLSSSVITSCTGLAEMSVLRLRSIMIRGLDVSTSVDSFSDSLMHASSWSLVGFRTVDSTSTSRSWYMVKWPRTTHSATSTCLSNARRTDLVFSAFTVGLFSVCITRSTCFWLKIHSKHVYFTVLYYVILLYYLLETTEYSYYGFLEKDNVFTTLIFNVWSAEWECWKHSWNIISSYFYMNNQYFLKLEFPTFYPLLSLNEGV